MSFGLNQQDVELLSTNPNQLLVTHQSLIENVIYLFIRSGYFKFQDHDEIKQQINEELLNRMSKIQKQFQGKSLFKTYLTAVVKNICNEIIRNRKKAQYICYEEIITNEVTNETMNSLIFEEEIVRLKKAIGFFYKQKNKLILTLKLKFRMPFDFHDFKNIYNEISVADFDNFVKHISPYQECSDLTIFTALTSIFNKYEAKENAPDALRKWIKQKIDELVDILNGNPPAYRYTEETLQILFEKCFFHKEEIISKIY